MSSVGKKLINHAEYCVDDSLDGLVMVNPGIRKLAGHRVVVRADIERVKEAGKVTVVCGGGSGHEPGHAGFVGPGMLSAGVAGDVFTSPPPTSILHAFRAVGKDSTAGTLAVVTNYTGDRLNFGLAVERARAEGIEVEMLVVGEDCALTSADRTAGRRGLAGTLLVYKIAGAMADEGCSLKQIYNACEEASRSMGTIGLSLSPCSVPGAGPSFQLAEDEMELGLGIHGEAGVRRMKVLPAKQAVMTMFEHMTNPSSSRHLNLNKGDGVALMVNNLGGTSFLEMNIVAKEAITWLEEAGVFVERVYCGSYLTSLEMAGVSLTVMTLTDPRRRCLDADTEAPGWSVPCGVSVEMSSRRVIPVPAYPDPDIVTPPTGQDKHTVDGNMVYEALSNVCHALHHNKDHLNQLDTKSGDGDCGTTLSRGAKAVEDALRPADQPGLPVHSPADLLHNLAAIVEITMGGSSGALYSLLLTAAAGELQEDTSALCWSRALGSGIKAIIKYGRAQAGDRTMLDALCPAHQTLTQKLEAGDNPLDALQAAAKAAENGAQDTVAMTAQAGRASYVSRDQLTQRDPGAQAVAVWINALAQSIGLHQKPEHVRTRKEWT